MALEIAVNDRVGMRSLAKWYGRWDSRSGHLAEGEVAVLLLLSGPTHFLVLSLPI